MTDQEVKGAVSGAKGTLKEGAGQMDGDPELKLKGKALKAQGKAQATMDRATHTVRRNVLLVTSAVGAIAIIFIARMASHRAGGFRS